MQTTINRIRKYSPCTSGWTKLLKYLNKTKPDDEPISILTILESNGLEDTIWCFRAVDGFEKEKRMFAIKCARSVQHLIKDERSLKAIDIAEKFINGLATLNELKKAKKDADAAHAAARLAYDAAAYAGADAAAYAAAGALATAGADAAAYAAAGAYAAADAAYAVAYAGAYAADAAYAAARLAYDAAAYAGAYAAAYAGAAAGADAADAAGTYARKIEKNKQIQFLREVCARI